MHLEMFGLKVFFLLNSCGKETYFCPADEVTDQTDMCGANVMMATLWPFPFDFANLVSNECTAPNSLSLDNLKELETRTQQHHTF